MPSNEQTPAARPIFRSSLRRVRYISTRSPPLLCTSEILCGQPKQLFRIKRMSSGSDLQRLSFLRCQHRHGFWWFPHRASQYTGNLPMVKLFVT
jgi:hypothetical protein